MEFTFSDEAHVGTTKLEGSNKGDKGDKEVISQAGDLSKGDKTVPTKERESEIENSALDNSLNDHADKENDASTEHTDDDSKSSNETIFKGNNLPIERVEEKIDSSEARDNKELSKEANDDEKKPQNENDEADKSFDDEDAKESSESSKHSANGDTEAVQNNSYKGAMSSNGGIKDDPNVYKLGDEKTIQPSKNAVEGGNGQSDEGTDVDIVSSTDIKKETSGKATKDEEKDTRPNPNSTSKSETDVGHKNDGADRTKQDSTIVVREPSGNVSDTISESSVSAEKQGKPDQRQTRSQTQKTNKNDAQPLKVILKIHFNSILGLI